jgi:hypothetical protein
MKKNLLVAAAFGAISIFLLTSCTSLGDCGSCCTSSCYTSVCNTCATYTYVTPTCSTCW